MRQILGSVSHLNFLTANEKDTFKTAFEIDQRWIVELGADRTPHISQAQSVNIFVPADIHKKELHDIHFQAWKKGLKSFSDLFSMLENECREVLFYVYLREQRYLLIVLVKYEVFYLHQVQQSIFDRFQKQF